MDADKVQGQDVVVNRSRDHLELIQKPYFPGLMDDTHFTRQIVKLIGDQVAQGLVSRDTAPGLHDAARDRPLEADIKARHCDNWGKKSGTHKHFNLKSYDTWYWNRFDSCCHL